MRELPDYDQFDDVSHDCDYQVFVQFSPVTSLTRQELDDLEDELEHPTGRSIAKPPQLLARAVLFSPNCSVAVSTQGRQHIVGTRIEPYLWKATRYALAAFALLLLQIVLLIRQIEHTPTPSSVAKVSYLTIAMQAVLDSYLCMLHLTGSVFYSELYLSFAGVSFLTFVLLSMFDMRYLVMVWRVQRPEAGDTSTSEGRRELWLIYFRFYAALILGLFVIYMYAESVRPIASALLAILLVALYSYWIPQIWRNIKRGTSQGLRMDYVVGTTVLRLFFPVYAFACPDNIAFITPTPLVGVLVAYSLAQTAFLILQDVFGPRFFVPAYFLPPTYNYHPVLPPTDEELDAGAEADGNSGADVEIERPDNWEHNASTSSNRVCAVCMLPVDVAPPTSNVLGRAAYMVTPCHHIFHSECLTRWMAIKLECPVCRAPLPPV
ncbi:hypothetical protein GQ54DRAFT_264976 [Martensiomyces pterosporus]|nr:hypothetical protein GQ54DRAFT_264976 [Martensiomyces pterosporus]